jgi:hypothetical protein
MDTPSKALGRSSLLLHLILDAQKFAFIIVTLTLFPFSNKRLQLPDLVHDDKLKGYDIPNVEDD